MQRNGEPYIFGEDSRLLYDAISRLDRGNLFLEIGVGGGGNLGIAQTLFKNCVGTDIRLPTGLNMHLKNSVDLVIGDRGECFREGVFDAVAFNPPYVPSESIEDLATDGGPRGIEVPLRFLESALRILNCGGVILMVLSSESSLDVLRDYCLKNNLKLREAGSKDLFFERLFVYEVTRAKE